MRHGNRRLDLLLAFGAASFLLLPWYRQEAGFFGLGWLGDFPLAENTAPGILQLFGHGRLWLLGVVLFFGLGVAARFIAEPMRRGAFFAAAGAAGLVYLCLQGLAVGFSGWTWGISETLFGSLSDGQPSMGAGAVTMAIVFVLMFAFGLVERGVMKGDAFVVGSISLLVFLVFVFVFYPIGSMLRTRFPFKKGLRLLTVLPIITPPFVIGLALVLLFGRAGVVTETLSSLFGIEPGRWLYGLTGIWIAQVLSFTPISFLVLIGVVEGVSPSMEEASQTLRADRWRTFWRVSLPLMKPGLANAFLIGFIESMADFGNPLVLGGSNGVLSTEIFFAVVGSQNDPSRAAVLALVLLFFTLSAFLAQRLWLSGKNFATVTGKGDSGAHIALPQSISIGVHAIVIPWMIFTVVVYGMILVGGFVTTWGLDNTLTLEHYARAFSISIENGSIAWTGVAWNSFWTTMEISLISAPLTAAVGLLTAYIIVRQKFAGRNLFEFALMMSFAIPGTVIGVSYIMAFNLPPLEMTGSALILIACFVFRNMPVGVRGGIAAMSQLDKSLDEASLTLRADSFRTVRKVILPLLRPAITAALVFSFVRAITSISAVIFLVSAEHSMATSYIVGLVENGEYGVAIAYSSMLIVVMITVIGGFQLLVGERKLRRENRIAGLGNTRSVPLGQEKTA